MTGAQYANDMFVGDANFGNIYHFGLNQNQTVEFGWSSCGQGRLIKLKTLEILFLAKGLE